MAGGGRGVLVVVDMGGRAGAGSAGGGGGERRQVGGCSEDAGGETGLFLVAAAAGRGAAGAWGEMDAVTGGGKRVRGEIRDGDELTAAGGCPVWNSESRSRERDTCGCALQCARECGVRGGLRW